MTESVFVLERVNWRRTRHSCVRLPGATRVRSFDDPQAAYQEQKRLEAEARDRVNPFICGGSMLHCQVSLPPEALCDWLYEAGITPPPDPSRLSEPWAKWWAAEHAQWTTEQRERVWEAVDRIRFYRVVERELCPLLYVVVEILWLYNDSWYDANPEGGSVVRAFRTRAQAQAYCDLANQQARERERPAADDEELYQRRLNVHERYNAQVEPLGVFDSHQFDRFFVDSESAVFFEVLEVESPS